MKEENELIPSDLWIMTNYAASSKKYWAGMTYGTSREGRETEDILQAEVFLSGFQAKQFRIEFRKLYPIDQVQDIRIQRITEVLDQDAQVIMLEKYKESLRESAAN